MDTPLTDAASFSREFVAREIHGYDHKFVLADFARDLERSHAELVEVLTEAENALADYIPTIERDGAVLNYGHSVLQQVRLALAKAKEIGT